MLLGAADYVLDNKFGLGKEVENGILTCGRLILSILGFMVLAPIIVQQVGPVVAPTLRNIGADPSIFAGFLSNDAGGTVLAMKLADTPEADLFSGLIVSSMMGTTVMFNIPLIMSTANS